SLCPAAGLRSAAQFVPEAQRQRCGETRLRQEGSRNCATQRNARYKVGENSRRGDPSSKPLGIRRIRVTGSRAQRGRPTSLPLALRGVATGLPRRPSGRPVHTIFSKTGSVAQETFSKNPMEDTGMMNTRHPACSSLSRRDVLLGSAAALMGAYGLAPRYGLAADVPLEYDGSKFQMAAPEPNPKRGGVMRYGILNRPPHFDVHQSGTVGNIGTQGCMFDNLIRRDPRDSGKSIIPDLAHSWEIAKDGKTYTFHLRQGVQFHDGTDFTSADIKATFDRIAKPPAGVSIPRTPLFRAVSEINARDKYTVEFKLAAPRPVNFMMSAFASGWNVIFSKKTLEENNYDLRKVLNIPGTGPFKTKRRVENEVWVMERNSNYWNKGLPYLDG